VADVDVMVPTDFRVISLLSSRLLQQRRRHQQKINNNKQEAQLPQTGRAMLRVIAYFAKITRGHSNWHHSKA